MQKKRELQYIRGFCPYVWLCLLIIQLVVCISTAFLDKFGITVCFAFAGPVFFSLPLFVVQIVEAVKGSDFIGKNLRIMAYANVVLLIIYAIGSVIWSVIGFTMAAFAEGAGQLAYAIAVNKLYIFVLPIVALISIVFHIYALIGLKRGVEYG